MRVGVTFGMLTDKKIETFWIIKILFCSSCQIKIYSYMIIYKNFDSLTPLIISSSYHKKPLLKRRYNTEWVRSLLPLHNQDKNKTSIVREQYGYTYHVTTVIITWHFTSIWILRFSNDPILKCQMLTIHTATLFSSSFFILFRRLHFKQYFYLVFTFFWFPFYYFWQIEMKCVVCIA